MSCTFDAVDVPIRRSATEVCSIPGLIEINKVRFEELFFFVMLGFKWNNNDLLWFYPLLKLNSAAYDKS